NNLIIFLSIFILSSCENAETERPDCSAVQCEFVSIPIKIKYLDKATNSPLFSQGSQYTLTELKVTGKSNSNYKPLVNFDPNDPSVIIIRPIFGGEVLTLRNFSSDNITMHTKARNNECCSPIDVISLKINGETICAPCNNLNEIIAVIKK
uniref:hypothetical protein n=1 Tax=Daejeonella sp. TaxID=2805397 RepID=UPI0039838036